MDGGFGGSLRFEVQYLGHEKFDLHFRLVVGPSKLFNTSDQGFCPVRYLLWVAGGVGSCQELGSRSSGHGSDTK